jgi:hypothetical protein
MTDTISYWNKDNFDGLSAIAEALGKDAQLAPMSRYCALRAKGLRKLALAEIGTLISVAKSWEPKIQREAIGRLLRIWHAYPEVHQLLPRPLLDGFIMPILNEWVKAEPSCGDAWRWIGMVTGDEAALKAAISIDPNDDMARFRLVAVFLGCVDFASHHLVEGKFLGDEKEAEEMLLTAESLLEGASDGTKCENLRRWRLQISNLLADWITYRQNPDGEFREWCKSHGRGYHWPTIIYYDHRTG